MTAWQPVPLGSLLKKSEEVIWPVADARYTEVTVRLWGRGVVARGEVDGLQLVGQRRFRAHPGQFIASRIDARNGALGVVPASLDGAIVTNDFPLFDVDPARLDAKFLGWLSRTESFVDLCRRASEGTTNRVRLKEDRFLALEIALPKVEEQRRIVARIEAIAGKVEEARRLSGEAEEEFRQVLAAEERKIWPDHALIGAKSLEEITEFLARGKQSEQGDSNHFLIKTQHVQMGRYIPTAMRLAPHVAVKVKSDAIVRDRDVLIACSAAGCLGRVARYIDDVGRIASTDTHVAIARAKSDIVDPDYLYAYLRGAQGQHQLRSRERRDWQREKIGFRFTEVNLNDLRAVPVPVVSLNEQRRIVKELNALQARVDDFYRLQCEVSNQMDTLLPTVLGKAFRGEL